ncbi:MAG: type II secretion system F family protein [Gemmatimonadota bacterium]
MTGNWQLALAIFLAVSLGVLSLALIGEGVRAWLRRRAVQEELSRLTSRALARKLEPESDLLKEERSIPAWMQPAVLRLPQLRDLEHLLAQADVRWGLGTFLMVTLGLGAGAGIASMVVVRQPLLPVAFAAVGALVPYLFVRIKRKQRFAAFEADFPEAIDLMGRAIRAGHAFSTGLRIVSEEADEPVAGEFRQVFEEQKFGLPLRDSLMALADRIDLVDLKIFVTAVLVQRDTGGNLAEILDNLSHVIRERFKFRRQLRVFTAHGRITGFILAVTPLVTFFLLYTLNPDYMSVMLEEQAGRMALGIVALMQVVGILVIRRIVDIDF